MPLSQVGKRIDQFHVLSTGALPKLLMGRSHFVRKPVLCLAIFLLLGFNGCDKSTTVPDPSCADGVRNGDETDVDCGGTCARCADGGSCLVEGDCLSGVCTGGVCQIAVPSQPSEISGDPAPCLGATETYAVTAVLGVGYSWTVPDGWMIESGQGTHEIVVLVGDHDGTISVVPSNSSGDGPSRTLATSVSRIPEQPSEIRLDCDVEAGFVFGVTAVSGVEYTWTVPAGWTIESGAGTNQIGVSVSIWAGILSVTPENACGVGLTRSFSIDVSEFAGGDGSEACPYFVATASHLDNVRGLVAAHFRQIAEISLDVSPYNADSGFTPIGTAADPFEGRYDGHGLVIERLYVNRPSTDSVGLFGRVGTAGRIVDVFLGNAEVTGREQVGLLAGFSEGTVTGCGVEGVVWGQHTTGGLIGEQAGSVEDSFADVAVSSTGDDGVEFGGLVGANHGVVWGSYTQGFVQGVESVGGLVGLNGPVTGIVTDSYSTAVVSPVSDVKLLLHMDEETLPDDSFSRHATVLNGSMLQDTTITQFGGGSAYFDGGNSTSLAVPMSNDFAFDAGDFTIDFWIRFNTLSVFDFVFAAGVDGTGGTNSINGGTLNLYYYHPQRSLLFWVNGTYINPTYNTWFPVAEQWYHIAGIREGNQWKIYVDGTLLVSNSYTGAVIITGTNYIFIGPRRFHGRIDELRVTKGRARWTANFTPPAAPSTPRRNAYIGGLVGSHYGEIAQSYSVGFVDLVDPSVGGLVGFADVAATTAASYWDTTTSGQTASAGGTGLATSLMKQQATFVGWDFLTTWTILEDTSYPYFP